MYIAFTADFSKGVYNYAVTCHKTWQLRVVTVESRTAGARVADERDAVALSVARARVGRTEIDQVAAVMPWCRMYAYTYEYMCFTVLPYASHSLDGSRYHFIGRHDLQYATPTLVSVVALAPEAAHGVDAVGVWSAWRALALVHVQLAPSACSVTYLCKL